MLFPDLSLTFSQRRRACVLDPALALSRLGLLLVRRLGEALELWMPREFWHILDNSQFYVRRPDLLFYVPDDGGRVSVRRAANMDEIATVMKEWDRIRIETDLGGLKFFWIGDGLGESLVPAGMGADLVSRYESLAGALDRRLPGSGPMTAAARDAAALAAALGAASVLAYRPVVDMRAGVAPAICDVLAHGVPCQAIAADDPLAAIEREHFRHLLVHTGAASLLWSGLNVAVLHLAVPAAATLYAAPPSALTDEVAEIETVTPVAESKGDPWDGAHAFWYPV